MSTPNFRALTWIGTIHCGLNKHRFRCGLPDDPKSRASDEVDETLHHIIANCSVFGVLRLEILEQNQLSNEDLQIVP